MKLTLQTELGGFDFRLSRASIIYLLGVAQKLEDEGDPKFDINRNVDNINREIDNKQTFHDVKPGDVIEPVKAQTRILREGDTKEDILETAKKIPEELLFPPQETGDAQEETEESEEDFEKMLDEFEQKQKGKMIPPPTFIPPAPHYAGLADGKYKGFMYIKCEHCGETRGFCAKQPIDEYRCSECGGKTKLKDLRRMFLDCECGQHYRYYTNETAEVVTNNCINCGSPVDMMLNSRRTAYVSIGGGTARKRNADKRISTQKFRW